MLELNELPIPLIIFLIAFGDALFPINFIIPGEPAFLLAGYTLGSKDDWNLIILVYIASISANQISYFLGRFYGTKLFKNIKGRKKRRFLTKARILIRKRGVAFIFTSHFLGPICWVTHVLAGAYRLNYFQYTIAAISGSFLAIAQFIAIGYFSAIGIKIFNFTEFFNFLKIFVSQNIFCSIIICIILIFLLWYAQKYIRKQVKMKNRKF
ncbi:MAG: VTT domain-containing protein [Rhizobiales bacterium]|nr:VTT domain-containing protein [Hyphomicrobiales bacterium]